MPTFNPQQFISQLEQYKKSGSQQVPDTIKSQLTTFVQELRQGTTSIKPDVKVQLKNALESIVENLDPKTKAMIQQALTAIAQASKEHGQGQQYQAGRQPGRPTTKGGGK